MYRLKKAISSLFILIFILNSTSLVDAYDWSTEYIKDEGISVSSITTNSDISSVSLEKYYINLSDFEEEATIAISLKPMIKTKGADKLLSDKDNYYISWKCVGENGVDGLCNLINTRLGTNKYPIDKAVNIKLKKSDLLSNITSSSKDKIIGEEDNFPILDTNQADIYLEINSTIYKKVENSTTPMDIVILLDKTESVDSKFEDIKESITNFVSKVGLKENNNKVSLIAFNNNFEAPKNYLKYFNGDNIDDFKKALNSVEILGPDACYNNSKTDCPLKFALPNGITEGRTDIQTALKKTTEIFEYLNNNSRENSRKIMLLFSDGGHNAFIGHYNTVTYPNGACGGSTSALNLNYERNNTSKSRGVIDKVLLKNTSRTNENGCARVGPTINDFEPFSYYKYRTRDEKLFTPSDIIDDTKLILGNKGKASGEEISFDFSYDFGDVKEFFSGANYRQDFIYSPHTGSGMLAYEVPNISRNISPVYKDLSPYSQKMKNMGVEIYSLLPELNISASELKQLCKISSEYNFGEEYQKMQKILDNKYDSDDIFMQVLGSHYPVDSSKACGGNRADIESKYSFSNNSDDKYFYLYENNKEILSIANNIGEEILEFEEYIPVFSQTNAFYIGEDKSTNNFKKDIIIILDLSGSMGSRLSSAKSAITNFVDNMQNENTRFSFVSFSDESKIKTPFTSKAETIKEKVNESTSGGSTNILSSLWASYEMITGKTVNSAYNLIDIEDITEDEKVRDDAEKIVLLFTDGGHTTQTNYSTTSTYISSSRSLNYCPTATNRENIDNIFDRIKEKANNIDLSQRAQYLKDEGVQLYTLTLKGLNENDTRHLCKISTNYEYDPNNYGKSCPTSSELICGGNDFSKYTINSDNFDTSSYFMIYENGEDIESAFDNIKTQISNFTPTDINFSVYNGNQTKRNIELGDKVFLDTSISRGHEGELSISCNTQNGKKINIGTDKSINIENDNIICSLTDESTGKNIKRLIKTSGIVESTNSDIENSLTLKKGWNLISFTKDINKDDIDESCQIKSIYERSVDTGKWTINPTNFDKNKGYWFNLSNDCNTTY